MGCKKLVLLAAAGVLGFSAQAAAQTCSAPGLTFVCTGSFTVGSSGAVLFKVTAKDLSPIDPAPQDITVNVCGASFNGLIALVARPATPKDVFKCTAFQGATCVASPVERSPTSSTDSFLVTLTGVAGGENGRFTIRRHGWDDLKVQVLDKAFATLSFGGVGCP